MGLIQTQGRLAKSMHKILGVEKHTVIMSSSDLARLILIKAHEESHSGGKSMLATKIAKECNYCIRRAKRAQEQQLGEINQDTLDVKHPWNSICLDLMGPFEIKSMINKRAKMKAWPVLFVCASTGALHSELMSSYGAESFLIAYAKFVARRGRPA